MCMGTWWTVTSTTCGASRPAAARACPQRFRYGGYWYDSELGWYWLSGREYDPSLEHFLQPDPSELEGMESYVYAQDNPIDNADPSGLETCMYNATSTSFICDKSGFCADIETILHDPNIVDKLMALGDLALWVPGLDEAKAVELLGKFGIDAERATELVREGEAVGCALCFPAGTLVATPHGQQAIQTLKAGDQVLAEDPSTGKVQAESVQPVIHDPASALISVDLSDGSSIAVTADHPFWVDRGILLAKPGWIPAGELRFGDELRTARGGVASVVGIRRSAGVADVYYLWC